MKKNYQHILFVSLIILIFLFQYGTVSGQQKALYHTVNGKSTTFYYMPHLMKSLDEARQELKTAFTRRYPKVYVYDWERQGVLHPLKIKNTLVFDNRLEFILKKGDKRTLYFSKLFDNRWVLLSKEITVAFSIKYRTDIIYNKSYYHVLFRNAKRQYDTLSIFEPVVITRKQFSNEYHLPYVDAFYTIQDHLVRQQRDSLLQVFKSVAEKYRTLPVKPSMSEEQRKYVVQANYYTNQKNYPAAIRLYQKVIKLNPTSYPTAYNNLGLLYAQVNNFGLAIFNMKKYILLEPNTRDARAAQDKIYEWELRVKRPQ